MTITDAQDRLLEDGAIQTAFSEAQAPPAIPPSPDYVIWLFHNAHWVFWPLVATLAAFVAVLLKRLIENGWRRGITKPASPAYTPALNANPGAPASPLPDPYALARAGAYDAAVHALLLHAFATLNRRHPRAIAPAQTGREIITLPPLTPPERKSVTALVRAVERARFAHRPLTAAEWESARTAAAPLLT